MTSFLRIGDDDSNRGRAARQIGLLAQDVNHGRAQDLRNRLRALDPGVLPSLYSKR